VLPLLYLHGLSSSDFAPALTQFLGTSHGLSAATITRLTKDWQDEATAFNKRSLADTDYMDLWVDGIHLQVRLEQDKVCLLVMIGVRADGTKELVALTDGHRESWESWADLLRDCKRRGMAAPVLALNALPKSAQPGAKAALAEIWNAEDREHAEAAARSFVAEYGTKWPKAVAKLTDDLDVLLEFYNYPAEHWVHLRTTNPLWVDLRHRPPSAAGHQGARIAGGRRGDGVQAPRVRLATVACRQRTPPRRSRPGRSPVREGPPGRTSRRIRRRSASRMTRQSRRS